MGGGGSGSSGSAAGAAAARASTAQAAPGGGSSWAGAVAAGTSGLLRRHRGAGGRRQRQQRQHSGSSACEGVDGAGGSRQGAAAVGGRREKQRREKPSIVGIFPCVFDLANGRKRARAAAPRATRSYLTRLHDAFPTSLTKWSELEGPRKLQSRCRRGDSRVASSCVFSGGPPGVQLPRGGSPHGSSRRQAVAWLSRLHAVGMLSKPRPRLLVLGAALLGPLVARLCERWR